MGGGDELETRKDLLQEIDAVATPEDISRLQQERREVVISEPVRRYLTDIVLATRDHQAIQFGASPRGSLGLMRAGQALAALRGQYDAMTQDRHGQILDVIR